ncbi:NUDIX domain-containing protein [Patescibacteria group bacterium]
MREEKVLFDATVCYLMRGSRILMAFKPEGDEEERKIGEDYWNGWDGGIEIGETPKIATVREVLEENAYKLLVSLVNLKKVAEIYFHNHKSDGTVFTCRVHFFFSNCWSGKPFLLSYL